MAVGLGRGRHLGVPGEDLPGVVDALSLIGHAIEHGADGHLDGQAGRRGRRRQHRVRRRGGGRAPRRRRGHPVLPADRGRMPGVPARDRARPDARRHDPLARRRPWGSRATARSPGVAFESMALGDPDASGRRRPYPIAGSRFEVELDLLVRAVGQEGPAGVAGILEALEVPVRDGHAAADPATGRTHNPRVWAIGDIVNGGAEVVNAVQAGKLAARSIREAPRARRRAHRAGPSDGRDRPRGGPVHRPRRHPQPEPVLAGQLPDLELGRDGRPGVRRGLGRRRVEDDRRADPQRHRPARHVRLPRPAASSASTTSSSSATARWTSTSRRSARSRSATRTTPSSSA